MMIKGSIHQEDKAVLKVYASNQKASKYMKQNLIELKGEIDKSSYRWGLQIPTLTNWLIELLEKISKDIEELNNIIKSRIRLTFIE